MSSSGTTTTTKTTPVDGAQSRILPTISKRHVALAVAAAGVGALVLIKLITRHRRSGSKDPLTGPGQFARLEKGTFWTSTGKGRGVDSQVSEKEITSPQPLLDVETGNVRDAGFARRLYWSYVRASIRAPRWRVKEWDYYFIANEAHAVCLTFANLGFIGCLGISLLSFEGTLPYREGVSTPYAINKTALVMAPFSKMKLHETSEHGTSVFAIGDTTFEFTSRLAYTSEGRSRGDGDEEEEEVVAASADASLYLASTQSPPPVKRHRTFRRLRGQFAHMFKDINGDESPLCFDLTLSDEPEDTMVIATPFAKKGHFYYNQKINGMTACGDLHCGQTMAWTFAKKSTAEQSEDDAIGLATLDWGRGVWTYDNTWYWASLQTRLDCPGVRVLDADGNPVRMASSASRSSAAASVVGPSNSTMSDSDSDGSNNTFGFNLGYGFGDTSAASENMLFFRGVGHKLGEVRFLIPSKNGADDGAEDGFVGAGDWRFTSRHDRLELRFSPLFDREGAVDLKVMCMIPHQVFGYFSGRAVLDDGTKVILDRVMGFAEKVHNRW